MKKTSYNIARNILRRGLCLMMLSGLCYTPAFAQTEVEEDTEAEEQAKVIYNKRKAEQEKAEKLYEMKTVKGLITDNATGQPLGGVRVQAFGYEKYSVLTEEDGTYEIKVPVFVHSLYLYVPGYVTQQLAIKPGRDANASMLSDAFRNYYADKTTITATDGLQLDETSSITSTPMPSH